MFRTPEVVRPGDCHGGLNTFARNAVYDLFARASLDDIFPVYFGEKYRNLTAEQLLEIRAAVLACQTPSLGASVAAAFGSARVRSDWQRTIADIEDRQSRERFQALPDRIPLPEVRLTAGATPGRFDRENQKYSRLVYSAGKINVSVRNEFISKCLDSVKYSVAIELPRAEPLTPDTAAEVVRDVLLPLSRRECPGSDDMIIYASFSPRQWGVTNDGKVVAPGSVEIAAELPYADIASSPAGRNAGAPRVCSMAV